jgi:hypothetical protein
MLVYIQGRGITCQRPLWQSLKGEGNEHSRMHDKDEKGAAGTL